MHDALAARTVDGDCAVLFCKPLTWMNRSGLAVRRLMLLEGLTPADVLVVCDDVALPLGRLRLRREGSAGGHNGLASVVAELGTVAVPRMRCGVGAAAAGADLADHVLDGFSEDERPGARLLVARAADAVRAVISLGYDRAMSMVNAAPSSDPGAVASGIDTGDGPETR
jgi:peptidyl-tRNA hydrolase, PTH1 family